MTTEEIISCFHHTESIKETARIADLSVQKVRRILITAGEWTSTRTDEINRLMELGKTVTEVASMLGITENAVMGHLPYSKGEYNSANPTKNAFAIRRHRKRKGQK